MEHLDVCEDLGLIEGKVLTWDVNVGWFLQVDWIYVWKGRGVDGM